MRAYLAAAADPTPVEGPFSRIAVFGGVYNNHFAPRRAARGRRAAAAPRRSTAWATWAASARIRRRSGRCSTQGGVRVDPGQLRGVARLRPRGLQLRLHRSARQPLRRALLPLHRAQLLARVQGAGWARCPGAAACGSATASCCWSTARRGASTSSCSARRRPVPFLEVLLDQRAARRRALHPHRPALAPPAAVGPRRGQRRGHRPAGQRRRRTEVWYAMLEAPASGDLAVELVPLRYDHAALAAEMRRGGLPEEFVETILTGWWTTCLEILPPEGAGGVAVLNNRSATTRRCAPRRRPSPAHRHPGRRPDRPRSRPRRRRSRHPVHPLRGRAGRRGQRRAWAHVRLFTPWELERLAAHAPAPCAAGARRRRVRSARPARSCGRAAASRWPSLPAIAPHLRLGTRVLAVGREGLLKHEEIATAERARAALPAAPRATAAGREWIEHADVVIDCHRHLRPSQQPGRRRHPGARRAGARRRDPRATFPTSPRGAPSWAGKTMLLAGAGHSAQTAARDLAALAPTSARHARGLGAAQPPSRLWGRDDGRSAARARPARRRSGPRARRPAPRRRSRCAAASSVEALRRQNGKLRGRAAQRRRQPTRSWSTACSSLTGSVGDHGLYRQLQVHECYATCGPIKLSAALLGAARRRLPRPDQPRRRHPDEPRAGLLHPGQQVLRPEQHVPDAGRLGAGGGGVRSDGRLSSLLGLEPGLH